MGVKTTNIPCKSTTGAIPNAEMYVVNNNFSGLPHACFVYNPKGKPWRLGPNYNVDCIYFDIYYLEINCRTPYLLALAKISLKNSFEDVLNYLHTFYGFKILLSIMITTLSRIYQIETPN